METKLTGKVIVVGDNIDTDQIYPGAYLALTDSQEIGRHCLEGVSADIAPNFPQGGIVVAGRNFGCGSSREHAPIALVNMGAKAVLADSFARIFYRNAVNLGLLPAVPNGRDPALRPARRAAADDPRGRRHQAPDARAIREAVSIEHRWAKS